MGLVIQQLKHYYTHIMSLRLFKRVEIHTNHVIETLQKVVYIMSLRIVRAGKISWNSSYLVYIALLVIVSCDDFLTKDVKFGGSSVTTTTVASDSGEGNDTPSDDDADNLSNEFENTIQTSRTKSDTDNDGFADGIEFVGRLGDPLNSNIFPSPFTKERILNPEDVLIAQTDSDQDGLGDNFENTRSLNPSSFDSDEDGFGDGLELVASSDPTNSGSRPTRQNAPTSDGEEDLDLAPFDSDNDGISDELEETLNNSNRVIADTDGDGFSDAIEYLSGSEADNAASIPNF